MLRRRALGKMLNLGKDAPPAYNFDGAHRSTLDELIAENDLEAFTEAERHAIAYDAAHNFQCWPDFPAVLPKLREKYMCASFTILSFRIIMDTARRNGLSWDAVFSCEAIGKYKILPEAYETVARYLEVWPLRYPRSERTNKTNVGRVSAVLEVEIEGRPLGEWPLHEALRRELQPALQVPIGGRLAQYADVTTQNEWTDAGGERLFPSERQATHQWFYVHVGKGREYKALIDLAHRPEQLEAALWLLLARDAAWKCLQIFFPFPSKTWGESRLRLMKSLSP